MRSVGKSMKIEWIISLRYSRITKLRFRLIIMQLNIINIKLINSGKN